MDKEFRVAKPGVKQDASGVVNLQTFFGEIKSVYPDVIRECFEQNYTEGERKIIIQHFNDQITQHPNAGDVIFNWEARTDLREAFEDELTSSDE